MEAIFGGIAVSVLRLLRLKLPALQMAMRDFTLPLDACSYAGGTYRMGNCRSHSAWNGWKCLYLAGIYGRCFSECDSGHYCTVDADSDFDGGIT